MKPLLKSRVFILLALLVTFAGTAVAGDATNNDPFSPVNNLIFDLSPTNGVTFRSADSGPGQGVIVNQDTNITQMAMFLNMPNGGDLKYMIWDMNNSEDVDKPYNVVNYGVNGGVWTGTATTPASSSVFFALLRRKPSTLGTGLSTRPVDTIRVTSVSGATPRPAGGSVPITSPAAIVSLASSRRCPVASFRLRS